jgi:hypothetical protein
MIFSVYCALCIDKLLKRNLLLNRYALDNRREALGKKKKPEEKNWTIKSPF